MSVPRVSPPSYVQVRPKKSSPIPRHPTHGRPTPISSTDIQSASPTTRSRYAPPHTFSLRPPSSLEQHLMLSSGFQILLHPFYPSIHPSIRSSSPPRRLFQEQKPKDISFSVPSNTHACAPASHSHHLKQAQGPSGFSSTLRIIAFRSVPFRSFVKYTSRVRIRIPHPHLFHPFFKGNETSANKQASKQASKQAHLSISASQYTLSRISIAHRLDSVLLRFPFGGLGCSVWMTG